MNTEIAFQDQIPGNHCFGCGPSNPQGLQIKSFWRTEDISTCTFTPSQHHCAGPVHFLNGGIISTIIDCHAVCTAIAKGYQLANRDIGVGEPIWFATGSLTIDFLRPVAIDEEIELVAEITEVEDKKITLSCELISQGKTCCTSSLVAVKVPNSWFDGTQ